MYNYSETGKENTFPSDGQWKSVFQGSQLYGAYLYSLHLGRAAGESVIKSLNPF